MKKRIATILSLGAVAAPLLAITPANATGDPSITTVYRPSSCNTPDTSQFWSNCTDVQDYAQNPNTFAFVFYDTTLAYDYGQVVSSSGAWPPGTGYLIGVAIQCAKSGIQSTGWQGPFYSGDNTKLLGCNVNDPGDAISYVVGAGDI